MSNITLNTYPIVKDKFENYPKDAKEKLMHLRNLIIETANELETITKLEETLKWGEPSYIARKGSTIRINWSAKNPNQYGIYFQCTSKLIPTFKLMYQNVFEFEGSRAIIFQLDEQLPTVELKKCIATALTYHSVKHLPALGM